MESRKIVQMNLFAGGNKNANIEWKCGHRLGERGGWNESTEFGIYV